MKLNKQYIPRSAHFLIYIIPALCVCSKLSTKGSRCILWWNFAKECHYSTMLRKCQTLACLSKPAAKYSDRSFVGSALCMSVATAIEISNWIMYCMKQSISKSRSSILASLLKRLPSKNWIRIVALRTTWTQTLSRKFRTQAVQLTCGRLASFCT